MARKRYSARRDNQNSLKYFKTFEEAKSWISEGGGGVINDRYGSAEYMELESGEWTLKDREPRSIFRDCPGWGG